VTGERKSLEPSWACRSDNWMVKIKELQFYLLLFKALF